MTAEFRAFALACQQLVTRGSNQYASDMLARRTVISETVEPSCTEVDPVRKICNPSGETALLTGNWHDRGAGVSSRIVASPGFDSAPGR